MNTFKKNNSLLIGSLKEIPDFPHNPNNLVLVFDTSLAAASARNILTNTYNWAISDGGLL